MYFSWYFTTWHVLFRAECQERSRVQSPLTPSSRVACVRAEHVCKQISSAFFVTKRGEHDQTRFKYFQCKINGLECLSGLTWDARCGTVRNERGRDCRNSHHAALHLPIQTAELQEGVRGDGGSSLSSSQSGCQGESYFKLNKRTPIHQSSTPICLYIIDKSTIKVYFIIYLLF